jgi:hypothetical protein
MKIQFKYAAYPTCKYEKIWFFGFSILNPVVSSVNFHRTLSISCTHLRITFEQDTGKDHRASIHLRDKCHGNIRLEA